MALKKSELYSSLWQSCDELRGGMDASQYKDYVLVLLFIKYVSDKYAGQPYAPITIPPGASLNFTLWRMYADGVDPVEVGRQWLERMAWATRRGLAVRDRMTDTGRRFTDVGYREALLDPIAQVERICDAIGLDYVSCSPYRVPIARLAAAQAAVQAAVNHG